MKRRVEELSGMLTTLFTKRKAVIGMINVGALPGTPANAQNMAELMATAIEDTKIYRDSGVDGIMIENMLKSAQARFAATTHHLQRHQSNQAGNTGDNALHRSPLYGISLIRAPWAEMWAGRALSVLDPR